MNKKPITTNDMLKLIKAKPKKPRKPRAKKAEEILPLTFGTLISEEDANKYYGFLYVIEIPYTQYTTRRYYGMKAFRAGDDWTTYRSSSKIVQRMIKAGMPATYKVLGYYNTRSELEYAEARTIERYWAQCKEANCRHLSLNYNTYGVKRGKK